jgi:tRNA (cmo5U34)-methyltransferase
MDLFKEKSKGWDKNSLRVQNAEAIAQKIVKNINLTREMTVMDLGAGTGLLSYVIAPHVEKIVAIDNSPSMLEALKEKLPLFESEVVTKEINIMNYENSDAYDAYDAIVSSMTIHHIEDIQALFTKLYTLLSTGGSMALADLDSEDGSFHSDNNGVFHFGFDREILKNMALASGFANITFETVNTIEKPHNRYSVFLMCAQKK